MASLRFSMTNPPDSLPQHETVTASPSRHCRPAWPAYRTSWCGDLVDASLAFVLREMWVGMYSGNADWRMLLALSVLILALGAVRTLAVVYSPRKRAADLAEV